MIIIMIKYSLQDSYDITDADLIEKLSMDDVMVKDSKLCVDVRDNKAVEVSKETEVQELPHVSTIKLSMA